MNKEAKVGFTIILVLLIIFVGVVAKRVYSSRVSDQESVARNDILDQSESLAAPHKETPNTEIKPKIVTAPVSQPTVVTATANSGKPPSSTAGEFDKLNLSADSNEANISAGSASVPVQPPSFMPIQPKSGDDNSNGQINATRRSTSSVPEQQTAEVEPSNSVDANVRPDMTASPEHSDPFVQVTPAPSNASTDDSQATSQSDATQKTSDESTETSAPSRDNSVFHEYRFSSNADNLASSQSDSSDSAEQPSTDNRHDSGNAKPGPNSPSESNQRYSAISVHSDKNDALARDATNVLRQDGHPAYSSHELHRPANTSNNSTQGRIYTVAAGDSLYDVARCELGKASRWVEIYELNRDTLGNDLDSLEPGMQITLPEDNPHRIEPVSRRPSKNILK